jgi:hypothetical protein
MTEYYFNIDTFKIEKQPKIKSIGYDFTDDENDIKRDIYSILIHNFVISKYSINYNIIFCAPVQYTHYFNYIEYIIEIKFNNETDEILYLLEN